MKMPGSLHGFVSDEAWAKLKLEDLEADDQKDLIETLEASFKGEDPEEVDDGDVAEVISYVQGIADSLREDFDEEGFGEEEVAAANATVEDMDSEEVEEPAEA
jgi:hypothetical protein